MSLKKRFKRFFFVIVLIIFLIIFTFFGFLTSISLVAEYDFEEYKYAWVVHYLFIATIFFIICIPVYFIIFFLSILKLVLTRCLVYCWVTVKKKTLKVKSRKRI